ncbi:MAG: radical SAM protein [Lachnospiraceae bacterium]|nr:radical SAM protein [Lachnospiraceae bacterium]
MAGLKHSVERKIYSKIVDNAIKKLEKADDRTEAFMGLIDTAEKFWGKTAKKETLDRVREYAKDPDHKWVKLVNKILDESDPGFTKTVLMNLGLEAFFSGTKKIRENREKYNCNIPWLILFDPTSACNLHCKGCWSGTYGHKNNLSFEEMDSIITQGKELGVYLYYLTGGEPMVRKKDILRLMEKHNDCIFAAFTNSTLIDEELCKRVRELGNLIFLLSIEGTPDTNDARRGEGHYAAVMNAMDLLRKYGLIYGVSICYTRENIEAVTDLDFIRMVADKGARFGFYFHYMPVGNNAVPELLPTVEQRKHIIEQIRYIRSNKCDIPFYPMDFQNDGEYVGGCIAGGRNYFHINSSGDAEPCVFIHFSDSNIREKSILEILQSPLFMKYHEGQPFNRNHLRPCPMLENPDLLRQIVKETGAHQTNEESEEDVEHLCAKCDDYAAAWAPAAEENWNSREHKRPTYENYTLEKREHPELAAFEKPAR